MHSYEHFERVQFFKLILIWRGRCHTINRRLAGTVIVDYGSAEFNRICEVVDVVPSTFTQVWRFLPKSKTFSSQAYEVSFLTGRTV